MQRDRPFLKLAPIKVEILRHDPLAVLFKEIISDHEISVIKDLATPRVRFILCFYGDGRNFKDSFSMCIRNTMISAPSCDRPELCYGRTRDGNVPHFEEVPYPLMNASIDRFQCVAEGRRASCDRASQQQNRHDDESRAVDIGGTPGETKRKLGEG